MILFPTMNGCSLIADTNFCTVIGAPHDIVSSLLSEVVQIDDVTSVQIQKVKSVDVIMASPIAELFCEELENAGIVAHKICNAAPKQVVNKVAKDR